MFEDKQHDGSSALTRLPKALVVNSTLTTNRQPSPSLNIGFLGCSAHTFETSATEPASVLPMSLALLPVMNFRKGSKLYV